MKIWCPECDWSGERDILDEVEGYGRPCGCPSCGYVFPVLEQAGTN
ncbi:hypothetical protein [Halocatena marina]|nr:hypothetical protein [Halocatena marina]